MAAEFVHDELEPWARLFRERAQELMSSDPAKEPDALQQWLERSAEQDAEKRGETCRRLYESLHSVIPSLPDEVTVSLEAGHRHVQAGDALSVRLGKRIRALGRTLTLRRTPRREIPVRLAARVSLEPPLSTACANAFASWCAFEATMLEQLSAFATGTSSRETVQAALEVQSQRWIARLRSEVDNGLYDGTESFVYVLSNVGSASLPEANVPLFECGAGSTRGPTTPARRAGGMGDQTGGSQNRRPCSQASFLESTRPHRRRWSSTCWRGPTRQYKA